MRALTVGASRIALAAFEPFFICIQAIAGGPINRASASLNPFRYTQVPTGNDVSYEFHS